MPPLLTAKNTRRLADDGRELLPAVSFAAAAGAFVKVVGDNGAGKTTLLKILCRLLPPGGGAVRWDGDGDEAADADDHREDYLYIGHKNALAEDLSPLENLRAAAALRRRPPRLPLAEALAEAGLAEDLRRRRCRFLSAGQRRRAALAKLRAFAARLWLLDEPLAALDADGREMLGDWLAAHLAGGGVAVATMHGAKDFSPPQIKTAQIVRCGEGSGEGGGGGRE